MRAFESCGSDTDAVLQHIQEGIVCSGTVGQMYRQTVAGTQRPSCYMFSSPLSFNLKCAISKCSDGIQSLETVGLQVDPANNCQIIA